MIRQGFHDLLLLTLLAINIHCSHSKQGLEQSSEFRSYQVQAESNARMEQMIQKLRNEIKNDLQKTVKEELLPAVQGLNYIPKEVREKQLQAKNNILDKVVIGRVEWVTVSSQSIRMRARIDTGAASSSIHAQNITEKDVDGKTYVQFETVDEKNKTYLLFKEVVKKIKIRSATGLESRYVVPMKVVIGAKEHTLNINLINRDHMTYKFLVGRNLLMGKYIIDVSQSRLLGK